MLSMVAGERTNAIRAQEFFLIEHAGQDSAQPYGIHQRNDAALAIPEMPRTGWMNAFHQFRHPSQAFSERCYNSRYPLPLPRLNYSGGTERQQADHRADLEPRGAAVGKPQNIVIEPIFFVPHPIGSRLIHSASDPKEMTRKLYRHVFEIGILGC